MRRPFLLALIGLAALLCVPALWNKIMTKRILSERDHTMKLIQDAQTLAFAILEVDSERESKGLPSIYPRDLDLDSGKAYLSYLLEHGFISAVPNTSPSMRVANLSRSDSADTIFVTSIGTMRDIHTMIHNLGGYPNYKKGFLSIKKNGNGQFYASSVALSATGQEPPIQPQFLEPEK